MTVETKHVVATVAYMAGVPDHKLLQFYGEEHELLAALAEDRDATVVRYLSRFKTTLLRNFKRVDEQIRYELASLNSISCFSVDEIRQLGEWGIVLMKANCRAEGYVEEVTRLLNENIDACRRLFYDWVKFEYIKDLFYVPNYRKKDFLKEEFSLFMGNLNLYPYKVYIHWNPVECGNLLYNDEKFLGIIYSAHGDSVGDYANTHDADKETKSSIYGFIDAAHRVVVAVDCENSDVFRLYGMIKNLDPDRMSRIEKIILYDDVHTTHAWEWLERFTDIPVQRVEVGRLMERKSLVDIKMTAGVCTEHYRNGIDSFILCSSDSDFWGLISSLPDTRFLVLYEYGKCGKATIQALKEHDILHCAMDDFYMGNTGELKKSVLLDGLRARLPEIIGMNGMDLARGIYTDARINGTESDVENFYNKYIKQLKLKIDGNGYFYVDMQVPS